MHIQQALDALKNRAGARRYTPEEIELARRRVAQQNSICSVDCPVCGGSGYVQKKANAGLLDPDFGKIEPCPHANTLSLYPSARHGLEEGDCGLNWLGVAPVNGVEKAVAAVQRALARGAGWVYLWGGPGLAKTHLLKIAVAESLRARRMAAYTRMAEILDDLRAAFDARSPSTESQRRLDWWSDLPVLAIDEFDRVRGTDYATERRFLLMDRRYESAVRGRSITLLTSNEDPARMEGYLQDRIFDGRFAVVHLNGDSVRPEMEW